MRRSKFGRFQVWNRGVDAYKHSDLAYNWDILDQNIGGRNQGPTHGVGDDFNNPSTTAPTGPSQWLHPQDTTQITNFGNRTLYNIVAALDFNSPPLGAVMAWWRPDTSVPLPSGWVPCDGATYTGATQHSYVATSIVVPDLRNRMILGAYETTTAAPTVALNRDGVLATVPSVDGFAGGPGIRAVSGSNAVRNLTHQHGVGSFVTALHNHNIYHTHTVTIPPFTLGINTDGTTAGPSGVSGNFLHSNSALNGTTIQNAAGPAHTHTFNSTPTTTSSGWLFDFAYTSGPSSDSGYAASAISGSSAFALSATEIMPQNVGLLYIIKIRKAGPLHNTTFLVGP